MYHVRLKGTHYAMGYQWGNALKEKGVQLLSGVPFPITQDRIDYGKACTPVYTQHFPEVLDEIRGMAEGNGCSYEKLVAVLFSMYCIIPAAHCSCFAAATEDGGILFGRNSDFLTSIEKLYMNTLYTFSGGSCSFNGNTTAFVQMEDGMNEHGLAVGLTSVAPLGIQPGINAGMLVRLFLEKCTTVQQVEELLRKTPLATSQTIIAADAQGNAALFECSPQKTQVQYVTKSTPFVCSVNLFYLPEMLEINNPPADTWQAEERYKTMHTYLSAHQGRMNSAKAEGLLAGREGFICQYDRKTGKDTVWSVVYNPLQKTILRVEGNPARKPFQQDKRPFGRG